MSVSCLVLVFVVVLVVVVFSEGTVADDTQLSALKLQAVNKLMMMGSREETIVSIFLIFCQMCELLNFFVAVDMCQSCFSILTADFLSLIAAQLALYLVCFISCS